MLSFTTTLYIQCLFVKLVIVYIVSLAWQKCRAQIISRYIFYVDVFCDVFCIDFFCLFFVFCFCFLKQSQRKEITATYKSTYGHPLKNTTLEILERNENLINFLFKHVSSRPSFYDNISRSIDTLWQTFAEHVCN